MPFCNGCTHRLERRGFLNGKTTNARCQIDLAHPTGRSNIATERRRCAPRPARRMTKVSGGRCLKWPTPGSAWPSGRTGTIRQSQFQVPANPGRRRVYPVDPSAVRFRADRSHTAAALHATTGASAPASAGPAPRHRRPSTCRALACARPINDGRPRPLRHATSCGQVLIPRGPRLGFGPLRSAFWLPGSAALLRRREAGGCGCGTR